MERTGVPLDADTFARLKRSWGRVKDELVARVDGGYGVFAEGRFQPRKWRAWANRNGIPWPRTDDGLLDLRLETFRDVALAHPEVLPMKELLGTLHLKDFGLAVGDDGRNRCPLRPFSSKTGRNQPSTSAFIFGPACWVRGLIKPAPGAALAYVDYEQEEFGIGAALSGDAAMREAYRSGDPYLAFAIQAGAAPPGATRNTHGQVRDRFKQCALGVQYGMTEWGLAARLGLTARAARDLLLRHKGTYPRYWRWSDEVVRRGKQDGRLVAAFGWAINVPKGANARSLRNFPLQANGAEMLRLACIHLTESGVRVCAPVHDALLVEAPESDIDGVVAECERAMRRAGECVLGGFPLRTDVKVVRHPDRYTDPRGRSTWGAVWEILGA